MRSLRLPLAPLLLVAAVSAPGCRAAPPSEVGPPGMASAPAAAASASLCPAEGARCAGDGEAEMCDPATGAWVRARCDERSLCLGGACVSLVVPVAPASGVVPAAAVAPPALDRGRLLAVRGEGWLDGWALASPLLTREAPRLAADPGAAFSPLGAGLVYRPLCAPDGLVGVPAHQQALLTGYLVSGHRREIRLQAGASGTFRLALRGAVVLDLQRPAGKPFPDESEAVATLEPGVNPVALLADPGDDPAPGFWLRVRDLARRPVPDLLFASGAPTGDCAAKDLRQVAIASRPVAGGFDVDLGARYRGLAPRVPRDLPFAAEVRRGERVEGAAGSGSLRGADLEAGGTTTALHASLPAAGAHDLAITFGDPPEPARHFTLQLAGPVHERITALGPRLGALVAVAEGTRSSLEQHLRTLERALAANEPDRSWLEERTADLEGLLTSAEAGTDPYRSKTGVVYRAYRSRLDGELQPYVAFVPRRYRPDGKPLPLILVVHGLTHQPEHALRTVIGEGPDDDMSLSFAAHHLPSFPDYGAILVAPWTYGTAGARQLGEDDVLRVIDEVRRDYRVDERRISLTGYSMGGTVSFVVPLHYPDRFAAAAPLCGYPNLLSYESVRTVPHTPWEEVLLAKRYIVNYAENGLHLPLHIVHGGLDGPERSAVVADRYAALGYPRLFDVQDDVDHKIQDYAYKDARMLPWLAGHARPAAPAHVRLVTGEYRYDRAYWVRLLAMRDSALGAAATGEGPLARSDGGAEGRGEGAARGGTASGKGDRRLLFADIDATFHEAGGEVDVRTRNVAALALDLGALGGGKVKRVVIDDQPLDAPPGATAFLRWEGGAWAVSQAAPADAGRKRAGVAGPLDDVLRHRQLVVYGTLDPAQTEANRLVAEHFSSYDTFAYAHFPVKADAEVADAELTGQSLVLIGNPASNRLTAALARDLPVVFEPGAVTVRGERHAGEDVGVSLIFPHPRDPAEYVVLHAGVGARGTLASRHLPQLAPDYLVYDGRLTAERAAMLLGRRPVLAGGFFDDAWK